MILIISSQDDFSTHEVIDWLLHYKHSFLRLSEEDFITIQNIQIAKGQPKIRFNVRGKMYFIDDFKAVWYRRSQLTQANYIEENISKTILQTTVSRQIYSEVSTVFQVLTYNLFKNAINSPYICNLNKLVVLQHATEVGLKIPHTEVLTKKKDLQTLRRKYPKLINKTSTQGVFVNDENKILNTLTLEVTDRMVEGMPYEFYPTLFQEKIEKKIELRIFFLENQFFGSAIFSQNDPQTAIDFRNYNRSCPNRTPPFKLPIKTQKKLMLLMKHIGLNSGSIDLILSQEGEYVFLEVNPIGQFKQVSRPCNYYLERLIAKKLIEKDGRRTI